MTDVTTQAKPTTKAKAKAVRPTDKPVVAKTALHKVNTEKFDMGTEMRYVKNKLAVLATAVECEDWKLAEATSKDVRFVMHQLVSHAKAQQAQRRDVRKRLEASDGGRHQGRRVCPRQHHRAG